MAKLKKTILRVGTHHSPDGKVEVTTERLKHFARQFKRFKQNDQVVPVSYDHGESADELLPVPLAEFETNKRSAKNTIGRLHDFRVQRDGQAADIVVEIHDEGARKQAGKNLIGVSPVISPTWTDGAGNEYEDAITHVDFVNHPVDHQQTDFEEVAVACALRMNLDGKRSNFYRLASEHPVADDHKDDDKSKDDISDGDGEEGEGGVDIKKLADEVLAKVGAEVAGEFDPMTSEGFQLFATAILNTAGGDDVEIGTEDLENTTPEFTALSLELNRRVHVDLRKRMQAALEDGQMSPAKHKELAGGIGAVKLSLDKSGKAAISNVEQQIEMYESLPKGTFWSDETKTEKLSLEKTEPPIGLTGVTTKEQAKALVDEVYGVKK